MKKRKWQTMGEMRVGKMFEKRGLKVLYQHKLGEYSLDIVLPEIGVNIEIYGYHHVVSNRIKKDKVRTDYIINKGYRQYIIEAQNTRYPGILKEFVKEILKEDTMLNKKEFIFYEKNII